MKKFYLTLSAICVVVLALPSCASIFCGTKAKITLEDPKMAQPVDITTDVSRYNQVKLPYVVKVKRGFKPTNVKVESEGYKPTDITVNKSFNAVAVANLTNFIAWGIDAGTGAMMRPERKHYIFRMEKEDLKDTTIAKGEATKAVDREKPGQTALERAIIRWYFESQPQGARIYWRVISSVPDQVKNTNELWLGTTPFEETRSFNILGLTYENARDVQIEIKVRRNGYIDQTKRFNVRQAIDQQEISSFFDMIKAEE